MHRGWGITYFAGIQQLGAHRPTNGSGKFVNFAAAFHDTGARNHERMANFPHQP
jgi:hypothetical protein